jgi:hypothetical protein
MVVDGPNGGPDNPSGVGHGSRSTLERQSIDLGFE